MNWKKFLIAFVVIYLTGMILGYIVHEMILGATYQALSDIWRPDMERLMWVQFITAAFFCFFFIYIFVRGYQGRGIMEGVRFGLIIWAFMSIPVIYNQYMVYPLPYSLILQWLFYDLIMMVILGLLVSIIYKPLEEKS